MVHQNTTNWFGGAQSSVFSLMIPRNRCICKCTEKWTSNHPRQRGVLERWLAGGFTFQTLQPIWSIDVHAYCTYVYIYVQYTYFMRLLISTRWTYRSSLLTNSYPTNWMMIPIDYSDYNWLFLLICIVLFCKVDFPHVAQGNNHTKPCDYAVKPI